MVELKLREYIAEKTGKDILLISNVRIEAQPGMNCDTCGWDMSATIAYDYDQRQSEKFYMGEREVVEFLNGLTPSG